MNREEIISKIEEYGFLGTEFYDIVNDDDLLHVAKEIIGESIMEEEENSFREEALLNKDDIIKAFETFKKSLNKKRKILTTVSEDSVKELKKEIDIFLKQFKDRKIPELPPKWQYIIKITKKTIDISMEIHNIYLDLDDNLEICGSSIYEHEKYTMISVPIQLNWPKKKRNGIGEIAYINSISDYSCNECNENFYWD